MNKRLPWLWVMGLVLIGCSKSDRINSDSQENYQKSIISMTKEMSQNERSSFMDNIALLNSKHGGFQSTVDRPDLRLLAHINGKSVADIDKESIEIRRQNRIAAIKSAISLSGQHIAQLESSIAAKLAQIQALESSIEAAEIQEDSRKAGSVKAKEILDRLVISEVKIIRPPENKLDDLLWMPPLQNGRIDFKIINDTGYQVEIENVTVESGNTTIVLSGGFGCKGLGGNDVAGRVFGADGKIRPRSEKNVQCEIQPNQDIGDSGTIDISGGRVVGVGEYNVTKSPFDGFGEFAIRSNQNNLEESRAELERMQTALSVHQTRMTNSCNELADFEESFVLCQR